MEFLVHTQHEENNDKCRSKYRQIFKTAIMLHYFLLRSQESL